MFYNPDNEFEFNNIDDNFDLPLNDIKSSTRMISFANIKDFNFNYIGINNLIKGSSYNPNYNEGIFTVRTGKLSKNKVKNFCNQFDSKYATSGFKRAKPRHFMMLSKERLQLIIYSAAYHARDRFGYYLNKNCGFKVFTLSWMKGRAFVMFLEPDGAINSIAIFYKKGKKFVFGIAKYEDLL